MPLSAQQMDRISRSFGLFSEDPESVRTGFARALKARGSECPSGSCRYVAELFELARSVTNTEGAAFLRDTVDRASWGAEEHALLEAVEQAVSYTWTARLESDWSVLVACAVERASGSRLAA